MIGCMNNLYNSVENMGVQHFRTEACKHMLLSPRNGAESHCRNLKLKIDDADPRKFLLCSKECTASKFKLFSYYRGAVCECGKAMSNEVSLSQELENSPSDAQDCGVFVKVINRYLISDDLEVMPLCVAATISLLSKYGITHWNTIEERTFNLGADEVRKITFLSSSISILWRRTVIKKWNRKRKSVKLLKN